MLRRYSFLFIKLCLEHSFFSVAKSWQAANILCYAACNQPMRGKRRRQDLAETVRSATFA